MITEAVATAPSLSVRHLCALLDVNRAWYYARPIVEREEDETEAVRLRDAIERIVLAFPGYGYRRVTHALAREGWPVNHKRVLRVMREESLLCHLKRRFVPTTDADHDWRTSPHLVKGTLLDAPDQAWVADITSIRLPTTFVYLAAILDAYSRRCVGWALSRWIDTELTLAALAMALARRQPGAGLIHHSDRGVQYASGTYVERLEAVGARISMAARGNPYENAQAESFFKRLKYEAVYLKEYRTFEEALMNLEAFIEAVYNTKRLQSSLGYRPPIEFEAAWAMMGKG
ncbi:MAG: IS3 family transposase [Thermomicrobiales bacterium]